MARQPTTPSGSSPGVSLWLGGSVLAIVLLSVGIAVGYGPVMALAPGPGESGESWAAVQGIDRTSSGSAGVSVTIRYHTGGPGIEPPRQGTQLHTVDGVNPAQVGPNGDWAYLPKSSLPPLLATADGGGALAVRTVGPWALIGNLSTATVVVEDTPVTVVAPAAMDVDPERKARFLSAFVSPYELHPIRGVPATIIIAPDALPHDGATYGTQSYVTQHAFWDGGATSVWIHEYVHTQQTFETTAEMAWFREASATYLSGLLLAEQYHGVTEADLRTWIAARDDYPGTTLAEESTWAHTNADYYRGARLLYSVDAAIRDGSAGRYTLVDVFSALNQRGEPITVGRFVRTVESYSGQPEPWLRPTITESDGILEPVPKNSLAIGK